MGNCGQERKSEIIKSRWNNTNSIVIRQKKTTGCANIYIKVREQRKKRRQKSCVNDERSCCRRYCRPTLSCKRKEFTNSPTPVLEIAARRAVIAVLFTEMAEKLQPKMSSEMLLAMLGSCLFMYFAARKDRRFSSWTRPPSIDS